MSFPLISVIIPTRDSEKTIGIALESIARQSYRNLDIIVVDDYSSDRTREIVLKYAKNDPRVRYLHMPHDDPERFDKRLNRNINAGYAARNFGFAAARGEFITLQDADDASLLNRVEMQHKLIIKYSAVHVSVGLFPFDDRYLGKILNVEHYLEDYPNIMKGPQELYSLAQKAKGIAIPFLGPLNEKIPFHIKRRRMINKLFFGSLDSFPGAGNTCMFRKEILSKVRFRHLRERVWPSFMGRGADRDFNFQIAEMFKNSFVFNIPLYMWSRLEQGVAPVDLERYIIN